jgi:signal transduction histidine kinase
VFRIVQEALTNAQRPGDGEATDRVVASHGAVEVEVRNPRSAARDGQPVSPGHGLVGMRERAALYGGELVAGPDGPSSFVVRARLVEVARDEGPR